MGYKLAILTPDWLISFWPVFVEVTKSLWAWVAYKTAFTFDFYEDTV